MDGNKKNLQSLTMDELTGVINLYPWFGGARKELCARMAKVGGSEWGKAQYSDTAMYVVSRTLITGIMRSARREDYSDKDVERLIKEYIRSDSGALRQAQGPDPYRRSLGRSVLPDNPFRPLGGQTRSLSLSKRRDGRKRRKVHGNIHQRNRSIAAQCVSPEEISSLRSSMPP